MYQKLTRKFGESWHHNTSLQIWNCNESKQYWSRLSMRWPLAYLCDTYVGSEPQEVKNLVCKLQRKKAKNADQYCQSTMHWHIHVTHVLEATHKRWKTLWKICQMQWVWTWRRFVRYRWNADQAFSPPSTSTNSIQNWTEMPVTDFVFGNDLKAILSSTGST